MKHLILAVLALLPSACSRSTAPEDVMSSTIVAQTQPRFDFAAPQGFDWNAKYSIWRNDNLRVTVQPAHEAGRSFQSVVDEFASDRMLAANMELISKEVRDVNGRPTLLVHGNRINGPYPQQFCIVAFGTEAGCAQIMAIYPTDTTEEMKAQLEKLLLVSQCRIPERP